MMIKLKKIIIILILIIIIQSIHPKYVKADLPGVTPGIEWITVDIDNFTDDSGEGSSGGTGGASFPVKLFQGGKRMARCTWSLSTNSYSSVYILSTDVDNMKNIDKTFLAGTSINLNIYENKGYSKEATNIQTTSFKKVYHCKYSYITSGACTVSNNITKDNNAIASPLILKDTKNKNNISKLAPVLPPWHDDSPPPSAEAPKPSITYITCTTEVTQDTPCSIHGIYTGIVTSEEDWEVDTPTAEEENWCQELQKVSHQALGPSYKAKYKNSNDIAGAAEPDVEGQGGCDYDISSNKASATCQFSYNRNKSCINLKTGKISYHNEYENCDIDSMQVPENAGYWKYFIPLNANSKNDFSFSLANNNSSIQSKEMCEAIIDKYDDYQNLIKAVAEEFVIGEEKNIAKDKVRNGCYYASTVTIPIEQKFYNEIDEQKLKGFNFYYKPININDPFPNGVSENSIWKEWDNQGRINPDISKSYNNITYIAQNINVGDVRNYNKNNPYTSWMNMNINGKSQFIDNEGIITRNNDVSFYKLGCGPANADWGECQ